MELRVLQYFLAVAREQSISGAANFLHLTQPTLSRQLKELEDELGKQLFIRGNRNITLTEDGMLLRKRAEEIVELVRRTEKEVSSIDSSISGEVNIGAGETDAIRLVSRAGKHLASIYPGITYNLISGDAVDVVDDLDKGLIDFGILIGHVDISKYEFMRFPVQDTWGVLMRKDSELAEKETVGPEDLWDKPIIVSRQVTDDSALNKWMGRRVSSMNIVATYSLVYNASLMVSEGLGYALTLDKLINVSGDSNLCFRPFEPSFKVDLNIVWKKYQVFPKAAEKFLEALQQEFEVVNSEKEII